MGSSVVPDGFLSGSSVVPDLFLSGSLVVPQWFLMGSSVVPDGFLSGSSAFLRCSVLAHSSSIALSQCVFYHKRHV